MKELARFVVVVLAMVLVVVALKKPECPVVTPAEDEYAEFEGCGKQGPCPQRQEYSRFGWM